MNEVQAGTDDIISESGQIIGSIYSMAVVSTTYTNQTVTYNNSHIKKFYIFY